MTNPATDPLEIILQQCASAAPDPWYPRTYAEITGVSRDSLDAPLEKLRLGGLVRLTEWVQGKGQGYALTPEGVHALRDPRSLDRVRDGKPLPSRQEIADGDGSETLTAQGQRNGIARGVILAAAIVWRPAGSRVGVYFNMML